jgi:hypothetical protein
MIAICAIVSGADSWTQVAEYNRSKLDWFKEFLELPNGIPSHDTFGRLFAKLDPKKTTPPPSPKPSENTGESKTTCAGAWISLSGKTTAASEKTMARKIWESCATWRSTKIP